MFLLVVLALSASATATRSASVTATIDQAYAAFFEGDVLAAVDTVETALAGDHPPKDRQDLLLALADFCVMAEQVECLRRHLTRFLAVLRASPKPSRYAWDTLVHAIYLERFLSGDPFYFREQAGLAFADKLADSKHNLIGYIDFSLLNGRVLLQAGDRRGALRYALQAEGGLLRVDPARESYFAATRLSQLIGLLYDARDTVRANNLLAISHNFILQSLPPDGSDAAFHKIRSATLIANLGPASDLSYAAMEDAFNAWNNLRVEQVLRTHNLSWLSGYLAGLYAAGGWAEASRNALRRHPHFAKRRDILKRGRFANSQEVDFAFAETLSKIYAGQPPDTGWRPLVTGERFSRMTAITDTDGLAQILVLEALLLAQDGHRDRARTLLKRAGTAMLERVGSLEGRFRDGYVLPSLYDKLVIDLAMQSDDYDGDADYDLMIAGAQFLSRSLRDEIIEDTGFVSLVDDIDWRVAAESLVKLNRALRRWEVDRFRRWMARAAAAETSRETFSRRANRDHAGLQAFEEKRRAIRRHLAELYDRRPVPERDRRIGRFPGQADLQSALTEKDAFVTIVPLIDSTYRICVNNAAVYALAMNDDQTYFNDLKLLRFAITATHPASDSLDIQYPVASARRVYDRIFGGFETCLKGRDHVYFGAQSVARSLPLQVLLTGAPEKVEGGYDLKTAPWVFRKFAVSYVSSPASLIYFARDGRNGRTPSKRFLGVGDPKLAGQPVPEGHTEPSVRLASLGELPETAIELEAVSALFEPRHRTVLIGRPATEEAVRSLVLSDYAILHFATHGVVPGELDGVDYPALVLTPADPADRRNDGLLTSREIADLDLNAGLVILSACNSANFNIELFAGELRGLTDAFILAGSNAVLASLWPVETETSKFLMTGLQRLLADDRALTIAKAHSQALRGYFREQGNPARFHPRFWGAFIVYGNGGARLTPPPLPTVSMDAVNTVENHAHHRETTGIARVDEDLIVLQQGAFDGRRRPSVLLRLTPSGGTVWQIADEQISAGTIVAFDDKIYVTGSRRNNGASVPVVRLFDRSGKLVRRTDVHPSNGSAFIRAAIPGPSDNLLLVSESRHEGEIRQIVFDVGGDGRIKRVAALPVPGALPGLETTIALGRHGDRLVAVASYTHDREITARGLFNLPKICLRQSFAVVTQIDLATGNIIAQHGPLDGIEVTSVLRRGDTWLLAGAARKGCGPETDGFLAELSEESVLTPLWRDGSPFSSRVKAMLHGTDDLYAVVARSRDLDILPSTASSAGDTASTRKSAFLRELRFDDFEIRRFDPGTTESTSLYGTVNQVLWVAGGLLDGRGFIVYGSNAGNPWHARITIP